MELLALFGLGIYAYFTYEMWEVAQDTLRLSQRAYVTIGRKDGVVADFVVPKDPTQDAEIIIYFQNTGHLPATLTWGTTVPLLAAGVKKRSTGINYVHPFKGFPIRIRQKNGAIEEQDGDSAVMAGDSVFISTLGKISQKDLADLPVNNMGLIIEGMFGYCDDIGTYSLQSFNLHYRSIAPSSSLSFDLAGGPFSLDWDLTSALPKLPEGSKYLFPCKTFAEREEEQKAHK